ncbi:hypothetical protein PMAYCL1PPCAC_19860, partial [Pristionchus mayeri]
FSANKNCIEHHVFNKETQTCEYWPTNKKYNVDHWTNVTIRAEDFHESIAEVIVRQHCWMTLHRWGASFEPMTLATSGYGRHVVASFSTINWAQSRTERTESSASA